MASCLARLRHEILASDDVADDGRLIKPARSQVGKALAGKGHRFCDDHEGTPRAQTSGAGSWGVREARSWTLLSK
ncbi:hypothetical protein N7489_011129 [Penicillium chrysogenum]|uniref:Uncharacterized protein n=1 Tax=Penicillium chrysogenum TaxID=5076 RepID=A0ABQ8WC94_PENCH|nr:uncharacterized protein N7489_011129 [Penicillium chrysogenum]KAJ5230421.1 hypothetical protein N7489_011129 [Penicillium chrysogenum]KAJ5264267.1 hypothetical protein N7505_008188 [Penicillium chrysogenum]KAJ5272094.1 hypothetical protein N7524_005363 [Penicillium chrysogenum]KAJ6163348.1 hypothetical protein N7497_003327 [Penicillium chrysogenum]